MQRFTVGIKDRNCMEKTVIISICGKQRDPEGGEEVIELVTRGLLTGDTQEGFRLTYEESELTGLEGTTTTFQIEENQIRMLRTGNLRSELIFEEGKRYLSLYETGMGDLTVGVNTQRAWSNLGKDGGTMELRYQVEVEDVFVSANTFHIEVKNLGGPHELPAQ